jgi:protein-tyrosine phosphatase
MFSPMGNFVDLHSHYLPALDDGATGMEMSVEMIRAVASLGFSDLYATPHQRAGMFMPDRRSIDDAFARVSAEVARGGAPARLGLGAENFWDDVFHDRLRQRAVPTYGGGNAFLFEVNPQLMPPAIENELFQIHMQGYLPVMAHPERYVAIQRDPALADRLGRHAGMLVDLGAIDGAHGKLEMKTARRLVLDGLAHAAASDIHRPEDRAPVAAGMEWIRKQRGAAVLDQMLAENPRRLLAGELPDPPSA